MKSLQLRKRIEKQTELTDLIGRADAMGAVQEHFDAGGFNGYSDGQKMMSRINALPSKGGDAEILNEDFRPKYMQQCPNNGADLISRADAIDAIDKLPTKDTPIKFYEVYRMAINDAEWAIDALPSAELTLQTPQTHGKSINPSNAEVVADYISRADAMDKCKDAENELTDEAERKGLRVARFIIGELPSADAVPQLRQTDTLIIADALRYLAKDTERHLVDRTRADALRQQFLKYGASMCKGGAE